MHRFHFLGVVLLFTHAAAALPGDPPVINARLRGVLVRSPGAASPKIPFVKLSQETESGHTTLLCKLALPGDDYVRDALAPFLDHSVLITGELQIHPNVVQKDGSRQTEYTVQVRRIQLAENKAFIIGPWSPDQSWFAVSRDNGLKLYNSATNKGHLIYQPHDAPEASAINSSATAIFSPDGRYVYTRQGLRSDLWSLPDVKPIPLRAKNETERLVALSYGGFSQDGKFLIMHGHRKSKRPDLLLAFRTATGEEVARLSFDQPAFGRKFSFSPDGRTIVVAHDGTLTVLSLKTGATLASVRDE